jgi:hypothetical protein
VFCKLEKVMVTLRFLELAISTHDSYLGNTSNGEILDEKSWMRSPGLLRRFSYTRK